MSAMPARDPSFTTPLPPEAVPRDVALLLDESKAVMPVTLGCFPKTFGRER